MDAWPSCAGDLIVFGDFIFLSSIDVAQKIVKPPLTADVLLGSDDLGSLPRAVHPGKSRGLWQLELRHQGVPWEGEQPPWWEGEQPTKISSQPIFLIHAHGSGWLQKLPLLCFYMIPMFAVFIHDLISTRISAGLKRVFQLCFHSTLISQAGVKSAECITLSITMT